MPEALLQTKLYIPSLRPNLVRRPQLVRQLEQGQQSGHKLTLISAPAGFGKTTLVAEWLERKAGNGGMEDEGDLAWLSLDEGDNDLVRFLMYVVTALNQAGGEEPAVGKGALEMLRSSRSAPPIDILVSLINDVAGMPERIVLVLDDYHIIDSQPIDEALTFLLEHMPPNMHLIIATREDPNLPLARLRALGQLTELRASALRFSSSEAADFLNSAMGMDLSPAEVDALESRTEGWIAGLQLAALALQGQRVARKGEDPAAFITDFSGGHRFVLDYLLEEVIEQQTPEIERFLLQTAVLDRLNGSLCDALTGQENGRQTLQWLERTNLFITGLDQERNWYRYHHLFADLLRKRLVQRHPDWAATLNQQASDWCKQNDLASEAIEYALRAEDYGRAAQVLEGQLEARWGKGTHGQLRRWLDALPEEELSIRPMLAIFQARYQCNRGQLDEAERTLAAVDRALGLRTDEASQGQPEEQSPPIDSELAKLQARALATRALLGSYQGDVPSIIRYASRALALHPQDDLTWRSVTALTLGNAHGFKGDMTAAYEARFKGLQSCQEAGDSYFILIAFLEVAITLREQGRLRETIDICRQQFQFAAESGLGQTTAVGWLLGIWGETLAEMGDLDGAIERVEEGFALTRHGTDLQMLGWSVMCLIRTLYTRGEFAKADGLFRQMENRGGESQMPPWITSQMAIWRARIWLAQGNVDAASLWAEARWLDSEEVKPFQEIGFFLLFDYMMLARILIAQERFDEASRLLAPTRQAAELGGRTSSLIEILLLQALALVARGDTERALSKLEGALTLAEPEGFVHVFVDEGRPAASLLREALNGAASPAYVRRLLMAFPAGEPMVSEVRTIESEQSELIEPLSEREIEVLQIIATGLTNREIADRLYLSLNTVKVHTRNIYGKLGVNNRTQAVARARALGVLDLS